MNRETAIALARESLEKEGLLIKAEPDYVELMAAEVVNKHLTAKQVLGPQWIVSFPLIHPNYAVEAAHVSIDDFTGVVSAGGMG